MGIAAQYVCDDKVAPKDTRIDDIFLDGRDDLYQPDIQQIAVFLQTNPDNPDHYDLVLGKDVHPVLQEHPHLQDQALEFVKLALHPNFDEFMEVVHVKKVLVTKNNRGKLQDYHADLIEYVIQGVRNFYKDREMDVDSIDTVPVVLQLCVPAMWEDEQRGILRNAAKEVVGVVKVELREEPLCSAITITEELLKWRSIEAGQCSLIVDCGAGTLDMSATRLDQVPSGDQDMVLTRIGICSGNDAGSQMLNHQLSMYIRSGRCPEVPNLQKLSKDMKINEHDILRQASDQFDQVKQGFPGRDRLYSLRISGGDGAEITSTTIYLEHELIKEWYDAWIERAVQLLRSHIERITEWAEEQDTDLDFAYAFLSGGGMRSSLLRAAMGQVLEDSEYRCKVKYPTTRLPCARGALMHHTFQVDTLPSRMNFFVTVYEPYMQKLHGVKTKRKDSEWASDFKVTQDRLYRIISYDNGTFTNQRMIAITFNVAAEPLGRLHVDLYWSLDDYEDSSALKDQSGKIHKGIRSFPLAFADIPDLKDLNFQLNNRNGKGGSYYIVRGWVELKQVNGKLVLMLALMEHDYQLPWTVAGGPRVVKMKPRTYATVPETAADLDQKKIIYQKTMEVWDKDSSHFVTNSTGTCVSRGDYVN